MVAEFHARSAFSFLHGASHPEAMIRRAAELGYRSVALLDRMGFYGSARAHHTAVECGIRAVTGASFVMPDGSDLPLIAMTREGYRNLSRHLTRAQVGRESQNVFSDDLLSQPVEMLAGIVCLTGDKEGKLYRLVAANRCREAEEWLARLVACFGRDRVRVELVLHRQRGEMRVARYLEQLAEHQKVATLASNAPLYARRQERVMADAFSCLRQGTTLDGAGRSLLANAERYLKSPAAMRELFADFPSAWKEVQRLEEQVVFELDDLGYRFPSYRDPETRRLLAPEEEVSMLRTAAYEGARKRYERLSKRVRELLEKELSLILRLGFSGYFLIVGDIVRYAKSCGILCQGRGSAANSVVCYALGITAVDPVENGLLFERFLSENRKSWPDIDIDFPSGSRREQVIQYVYRLYAPHGAAMTANVITYKPRSAFREMSRVLGFSEEIADRFSKICGGPRVQDPRQEMEQGAGVDAPMETFYSSSKVEGFTETAVRAGVPENHPRFKALSYLYQEALRLPRHMGQHSGGMIICDQRLDEVVPLQPSAMPNRLIVQWDKDDCEDLGIIKVDLLGLGMLAAMEETLSLCAARGNPVDLAQIPKDDPATYAMMQRADTVGTFQVESRAQMATLPILKPESFYDVVIEVAIIRPGPIVGDLVHPYLNRKSGREVIDYIHPEFEPVLKRTLGVPLFQEQILRMAMIIAGFSGADADELRRAMSFKRSDERMQRVIEKLHAGMAERGIRGEVRERVVRSIQSFALYGFPESHAISFALIAYSSCYLKAHYPAEFYTGLLNSLPMGFYSASTLIQDARHHGIRVRPVCVKESIEATTVTRLGEIRLGLRRVKGLRESLIRRLLFEREKSPFRSLADFMSRVMPNARERRLLAKAGALNAIPEVDHRRDALWQCELPHFDDLLKEAVHRGRSPLSPMSPEERLHADFETQGHTTGPHPMRLWRKRHPHMHYPTAVAFLDWEHGKSVALAGMVICRQRPGTAKGHCFLSLEDETGIANVFVPCRVFEEYRLTISTEPFLLVHGRVQVGEGGTVTLYTHHLEALPDGARLENQSHDFH
ncbi:MAG: DNA polymerase III subunit alpha [Verrucomicrobiales bacterium]